jgi:hypothetical protein
MVAFILRYCAVALLLFNRAVITSYSGIVCVCVCPCVHLFTHVCGYRSVHQRRHILPATVHACWPAIAGALEVAAGT